MDKKTLLTWSGILTLLVLFAGVPPLDAQTGAPPGEKIPGEKILDQLLTALAANNYDLFVANAAPALQSRITRETFSQVSAQLSARLKNGYRPQYLGSLKQQGVEVYLWKITFQDGRDDMLARLVVQDGKAAGFWFQ